MVAMANADVERSLSRFSQAAGADLSVARAPVANAFFDKVGSDAAAIMILAKTHWRRVRPYLAFPEVKVVVPPEATFSYPSGHSAFGIETAILLAQMLPGEGRGPVARGIQFGFERAIAGSIIPATWRRAARAGTAIIAVMMRSPALRTDFEAARAGGADPGRAAG